MFSLHAKQGLLYSIFLGEINGNICLDGCAEIPTPNGCFFIATTKFSGILWIFPIPTAPEKFHVIARPRHKGGNVAIP